DKDGKLIVTDLKPGDYQFVETEAPYGYDLNASPIKFKIDIGQTEIAITIVSNELTTGSVELIKVDKDNQEIKLSGAEFSLLDGDGNLIEDGLTTNDEGKIVVDNLKPGNYQFVETKAPTDYQLAPTPIHFTIDKGQEVVLTVLAENALITGSVELTKVDKENGELTLSGAEFELQDAEGNTLQEGLTTDEDGKLVVNDL
ncbi:hypothetical protein J4G37_43290, partial [Microvirga sp. 3-52]|nr:hypothetical protein [Microvirga sp. 3-52]